MRPLTHLLLICTLLVPHVVGGAELSMEQDAREFPAYAMGGRVYVVGEVVRPGSYTLPADARLELALERAGGVIDRGSVRRIQIRRGGRVQVADLQQFRQFGEERHNPVLRMGDVVYVPLREKVVTIVGAVRRPNVYEIVREKTVRDLVALAGGKSRVADPEAPIWIVRVTGSERRTLSYSQREPDVDRIVIDSGDIVYIPESGQRTLPSDLENFPPPDIDSAFPLQERLVYVIGGVADPGPYPYMPYASVGEYVARAGGFTRDAKVKRFKLIRRDGSTQRLLRDSTERPLAGDTIQVSQRGMSGGDWAKVILGVVGLGLSASATVLAVTK